MQSDTTTFNLFMVIIESICLNDPFQPEPWLLAYYPMYACPFYSVSET